MQELKKKRSARRQFSHLPCLISQLLPILLERHMVAKEVPRDSPPRFSGFDESKTCIYHMGERGHDIDDCLVLKNKVQNLIDKGLLNFKEPEPTVHQYPLPNHQWGNVIEEDDNEDEYETRRQRRKRADRQFIEEAITDGETIAPLGDNEANYRFMVRLTPPAWARDPDHVAKPDGWGGMDEITKPAMEIPRNEPVLDIGLTGDFQDKLQVTPEVLIEEDNRGEDGSDGEFVEKPPKEAAEENLDAWFKGESVNVIITKPRDTLALE